MERMRRIRGNGNRELREWARRKRGNWDMIYTINMMERGTELSRKAGLPPFLGPP